MLFGAKKAPDPVAAREALAALIMLIPVAALDATVAVHYGRVRSCLERRGENIGNNDLWIASQALALGCPIMTNNVREFSRIPDLKVEDWSSRSDA